MYKLVVYTYHRTRLCCYISDRNTSARAVNISGNRSRLATFLSHL